MTSFRARQQANKLKSSLLLVALFALTLLSVWALGTYLGLGASAFLVPVAVVVAVSATWLSYWNSDRLVLSLTRARVVSETEAPLLHNLVEEMCLASGMVKPRIAIVDDSAPNAFATGRSPERGVIAYTTGMLRVMDRDQLQGVTAHELSHIQNNDILVAAVAATTAGLVAIVADIGIRSLLWRRSSSNPILTLVSLAIILLAPVAALLLKAAVSRKRESLADATAVAMTRNPAGLRRALEELRDHGTEVGVQNNAVAHVWIANPLKSGFMSRIFSTHPPLETRIAELRVLESGGPGAASTGR